MESIGGEDLIRFVSVKYENHVQTIVTNLGFKDLSFHNVWNILSAMLPLIEVIEDLYFIANRQF